MGATAVQSSVPAGTVALKTVTLNGPPAAAETQTAKPYSPTPLRWGVWAGRLGRQPTPRRQNTNRSARTV